MSESIHSDVFCSFCQQDSTQVRRLLQGREANICVECIVRLSASTVESASCSFCRRDNTQVERLLTDLTRISARNVSPSVSLFVMTSSLANPMVVSTFR